MNNIFSLPVLLGFLLGLFVIRGLGDYEYDYVSQRDFPTKWYGYSIVKKWEEPFEDEFGPGRHVYIKRLFKNYTLRYELIFASRINKQFEMIENSVNSMVWND